MKRVYDSEQQRIKEMQKFYASQSKKTFNYSPDDFSIDLLSGKWKHKDWKTWMKGDPSGDYAKSKAIVLKYIRHHPILFFYLYQLNLNLIP